MATYDPSSLGIKPPSGGFQQGGWYNGRQFWGGQLSDPGVINPLSSQVGAGQLVSAEVNAQSAAAQGQTPQQLETYLQSQRQQQPKPVQTPVTFPTPSGSGAFQTTSPVQGGGAVSGVPTAGMTPQPTIDLVSLYNTAYKSAGITDLESNMVKQNQAFADAQSKINDNPYLSEAQRVGRIQKLQTDFNANTANLQKEIATKKADIETQMNLQTKQFDINSTAAQQALTQFNTLLSMGALANASGEDIANFTRSTGIPSSMIYSAIKSASDKKAKEDQAKTQVIQSTADSGEVTVSVINTETGEIISQKSLGKVGNAQTTGTSATGIKQSQTDQLQAIKDDVVNEIRGGMTLQDVFRLASNYLDANEILRLYNTNSIYGPAEESEDQLKKYGVK